MRETILENQPAPVTNSPPMNPKESEQFTPSQHPGTTLQASMCPVIKKDD